MFAYVDHPGEETFDSSYDRLNRSEASFLDSPFAALDIDAMLENDNAKTPPTTATASTPVTKSMSLESGDASLNSLMRSGVFQELEQQQDDKACGDGSASGSSSTSEAFRRAENARKNHLLRIEMEIQKASSR